MTRVTGAGLLYSRSKHVRDESGGSRSCCRAGALRFPRLAHLLTPCQDIFLGILEAFVNARTFDHIAGAAAGYQVGRVLLAASGARYDEINGHHQSVIKAGSAIQSAVPAAKLITFQNFQPFSQT